MTSSRPAPAKKQAAATWKKLLLNDVLPEVDTDGGQRLRGGEGKIYFNARYYDPTLGRFLTEDPSRKGHSWYTYCGNNPITYTDPTGRYESLASAELTGNQPAVEQRWTRGAMAEWNLSHSYASKDWLPGSRVSSGFGDEVFRLPISATEYATYRHTGIDLAGATTVVSPAFYRVEKVLDAHRVLLSRIGTDIRTKLVHLADTGNLTVGQILEPGQRIGITARTKPSSGVHLHVEESRLVESRRVFVDPDKHLPAPEGMTFYWKREYRTPISILEARRGPAEYKVLVDTPLVTP